MSERITKAYIVDTGSGRRIATIQGLKFHIDPPSDASRSLGRTVGVYITDAATISLPALPSVKISL